MRRRLRYTTLDVYDAGDPNYCRCCRDETDHVVQKLLRLRDRHVTVKPVCEVCGTAQGHDSIYDGYTFGS